MSKSQQQSLDEDAVFLEVSETSPEFLHCEKERQAVERLLSAGPEAFYSSIGTGRSGCFLSPAEVSQITSWAQDYHFNQVQREQDGVEGSSEMEDLCSTYFPCTSETPAPNLDLGWPEKGPWFTMGSVTVHTNPPAEGEPPVREIIRRHLQKATQVIAIVTDRLTDGAIIGDLHNAASRDVAVYIILNQRSIQENFTINRLRHPNIRVRVLGGKTFCSRMGRTVVGEMKDKFLLVDLETVIHGSYSLTWTDAHLHRQLVTVLSGPAVDSFDREFRILFAASLPVAVTSRVLDTHVDATQKLKDFSNLRLQKPFSLEPEIFNPPSPPADSLLDWETMGVVQRECCFQESHLDRHEEIPPKNNMLFEKNTPIMDRFTNIENQFVDKKRICRNTSPVTNHVPDKSTTFNTKASPTDLTPERMKRVERIVEKNISMQLSMQKRTNLDDRTKTRLGDKTVEPTHSMVILSSDRRRQRSRRESVVEEESSTDETSSQVENRPSSRKPIILRVPQSESFSSLSDIMKRIQPQQSTSQVFKKGSNAAASEMSQSMMDLSIHKRDANQDGREVPRFKASCFDPSYMTPAFALMKKRNDNLKSALYRTPQNVMPRERPRSSSYTLNLDWRRSLTEREGEQE
ncbi:protein FAM83E isoform X2 [Scophthalmus maximus]|uniref:protein FAM83E isoform X2 n=1 Tax=Scophthalmus maximus TaxID=52904 RepID=UPI001FA8F721|nr:protein FAM83E isoform X2 [Scophthalmus maximus]